MIQYMLVASSLIVIAIADCNACVEGQCYSKTVLLSNVDITDQLAMDWRDNILYAQLHSFINAAFYINDTFISKMHVVQTLETSGMAVDQATQDLYTADFYNKVYRIRQGSNKVKVAMTGALNGVARFLFHRNKLYLSKKGVKNVFYFDETRLIAARDLVNYTITDFVKTDRGAMFVANDMVYEYKRPFTKVPTVFSNRKMILAIDKDETIYMGSTSERVIYRVDTDKLLMFAAYIEGTILSRFVFDKDNNIIVHDATNKELFIWKRDHDTCTIVLPHCGVQINSYRMPEDVDSSTEDENSGDDNEEENNDNIVYDFFWKQAEIIK